MLLVLLWVQFALGLATIPLSAQHMDGSLMMSLGEWAQRIVTFRPGAAEMLVDAGWVFKAHMFLGMTLFLVFPFTRLVHVWSGFATLGYLVRPYQVVRTRRTLTSPRNVPVAPAAAGTQPIAAGVRLEPGKAAS
jgi:nitrate reductase gamma subunit